MNELEGLGNQTEATGAESFEQSQEQSQQMEQTQTEATSQPQEEANFFEVKYNKEPMRVSYDEAPDYIQKGLNYDKTLEKANTYQSELDRVAKLSGYQSYDEMQGALDEYEKEQQAQQWRDQGIDPDTMNQFIEQHPDIQYAREMKQKEQQAAEFNAQVNQLLEAHPDLKPDDIPAEVWQVHEQQGIPLLYAYRFHAYDSVAKNAQQQAIQSLQQNAASSPGSLGAQGAEHNKSVASMSKADFAKMQQEVLNGTRTSF
ncbi:hypothetical protein AB3N02_13850 [Priestia aryabhattai]|uniref:hypothetical protein n=1 Tax=Priestia aryabhattai TaxID=412384 RepID=UPI0039A3A823